MARVDPLPADQLTEFDQHFAAVEAMMGFVPNSMPTMARVPGLLDGFISTGAAVLGNAALPNGLAQMVAQIASSAAGCRYCQAHTGHTAERMGVPAEKLADLWLFETSDHFDAAERAALRLAFDAASVPNAVTDAHVDELREHFDDDQIAGIVAVVSFFGFLNRWNDTMATDLEAGPLAFGSRVLGNAGWEPGRHV
ncbi:MAG: carboxymuconolactone decarboxylase family protein [Ilumatobacter sp.]